MPSEAVGKIAMNGIEKITARIEADAAAEAAVTAREAQAQCAQIRAEAERKAQEAYWTRAREGMKTVEDRVQRLGRTAEMEAKKTILSFKQETVAGVFDEVEKRLLALPEEEYLDFLAGKAEQAAVSGDEELVLNARDRERLGEKLLALANARLAAAGKKAGLRLAGETGDFKGGLIVRQGDVSVNATVDAMVEQARSDMASAVAVTLFS